MVVWVYLTTLFSGSAGFQQTGKVAFLTCRIYLDILDKEGLNPCISFSNIGLQAFKNKVNFGTWVRATNLYKMGSLETFE